MKLERRERDPLAVLALVLLLMTPSLGGAQQDSARRSLPADSARLIGAVKSALNGQPLKGVMIVVPGTHRLRHGFDGSVRPLRSAGGRPDRAHSVRRQSLLREGGPSQAGEDARALRAARRPGAGAHARRRRSPESARRVESGWVLRAQAHGLGSLLHL